MILGGLSPPQPASPEIQAIASQMKGQLETKANRHYSKFEAISYRPQVVAGMNYFIKVQVGDRERDYTHLRLFQALPAEGGQVHLVGYQLDKTRDDPITYF